MAISQGKTKKQTLPLLCLDRLKLDAECADKIMGLVRGGTFIDQILHRDSSI
jgi:hypothetical protein